MKRVVMLSVLLVVSAVSIVLASSGSENILIPSGGKYKSIPFPHLTHQETLADCTGCHNMFPKEPGIISASKASGKLKKKSVMNQCRGCHKQMVKAGIATGPVKCKGCHSG